jgi:calcineurin-like phosphoesterase family protein
MSNTFLISDHHLGHGNILTFKQADGFTMLRDFKSVDEMDEYMIERHNSVVRPQDKVYFLGDVAINIKVLPRVMPRLNGDIVLIKGNHDIGKLNKYADWFRDIRAYHQLDGFLLAHIPVHPQSLGRWGRQIHGHLHSNRVLLPDGSIDPRYISVCVEQINYTPISLEQLKKENPVCQ